MRYLFTALGVLFLLAAIYMATAYFCFRKAARRGREANIDKFLAAKQFDGYREELSAAIAYVRLLPYEDVYITSFDGLRLHAKVFRAENERAAVLLFHGYRSDYGYFDFGAVIRKYLEKGISLLLVDQRSHGKSEGKYIGFGSHESRDAMQWLKFMTDTFGSDIQIILHGVSMGCATVMMMSGNPDLPKNVKFTVADCGYTSPWAEFDYQLKNAHVPTSPLLDGANFFNKHIAKYDFKKVDAVESVSHAQVPMLFIHGTKDDFVPTYMVHELYDACSTDKDLLLVEGAGHAESYPTDSAAYEAKVKSFIDKYIAVESKA